jgi:hypothetical protein
VEFVHATRKTASIAYDDRPSISTKPHLAT